MRDQTRKPAKETFNLDWISLNIIKGQITRLCMCVAELSAKKTGHTGDEGGTTADLTPADPITIASVTSQMLHRYISSVSCTLENFLHFAPVGWLNRLKVSNWFMDSHKKQAELKVAHDR